MPSFESRQDRTLQLVSSEELQKLGNELRLDNLQKIVATFAPGGVDSGLVVYLRPDGTTQELFHYVRAGQNRTASYHIQSTTKAVIGTLTMYALMATGDSVDESVFTLAPGLREIFRDNSKEIENLTVRCLLNHCSGLEMHIDSSLWELEPVRQLQGMKRYPGETGLMRYSNSAFDIVGIFLGEYLREHPQILDFKGSRGIPRDDAHPVAKLHALLIGGDSFAFRRYTAGGKDNIVGSGWAFSTIEDLVHLPLCLVRNPRLAERLLVPIGHVDGFRGVELDPFSTMPRYEDPARVANGFFVTPYGYGTRGSLENNIDVAVRQGSSSGSVSLATRLGTEPQVVVVTLASNYHPEQEACALEREKLLGELYR